ncbi:zinc-dependent alcohol dehydrogenase [Sphingobium agri]|uniref:Alcohol dehydrogenase catalytic domain-containing protein n=1 Tax=Sphingobium agri TaxID=2933566 RepID=A0ABT0DZL7_9SPHN|nr:alcohol dehydrogenase catalytic domain-containing protein [Sphingobium agri]MCK0532567.1 alcohol dehydrogenase catalytic domain-containing protein [Sphingobium agri]
MRAAIFEGVGKPLSIQTVDDPTPAPDQVILTVENAGICGSDLHMTEGAHTPAGLILGHEFAGTISAVGSAVKGWRPGDRVTALPLNACNSCNTCDQGLPALCSQNLFTGCFLTAQGAYAQYVAARGSMLQRLPDGVSFAEGAMVEPLAVGHHIVGMAELPRGASVLVLGGGPIGAAVTLFARHAGARHVVVSEMSDVRRNRVLEVGATAVIDPAQEDVLEAFRKDTGEARPAVVFECVGLPGMIRQAVDLAAVRGCVVVAGVVFQEDSFAPIVAMGKEVTIRFSQAYTESDFAAVIDALARGEVEPRPLHTSTVSLDELPAAFEALRKPTDQCKVLIKP